MPGKVMRLVAHEGDAIESGAPILVLEAMKMEIPVNAPSSGTVRSIAVAPGEQVSAGDVLAELA